MRKYIYQASIQRLHLYGRTHGVRKVSSFEQRRGLLLLGNKQAALGAPPIVAVMIAVLTYSARGTGHERLVEILQTHRLLRLNLSPRDFPNIPLPNIYDVTII